MHVTGQRQASLGEEQIEGFADQRWLSGSLCPKPEQECPGPWTKRDRVLLLFD